MMSMMLIGLSNGKSREGNHLLPVPDGLFLSRKALAMWKGLFLALGKMGISYRHPVIESAGFSLNSHNMPFPPLGRCVIQTRIMLSQVVLHSGKEGVVFFIKFLS